MNRIYKELPKEYARQITSNLIDIIKSHLKYGYGFDTFINQGYQILEYYKDEELKKIWNNTKNRMGREF
jgi:hypothetical protein